MSAEVTRVTLFKIPNVEDQQRLVDKYKEMPRKAVKDGKPYITAVKAGKAEADQRAQGYTVVAISVFNSPEDFDYYDTQCAAHSELRQFARTVSEGFAMMYFKNEVV